MDHQKLEICMQKFKYGNKKAFNEIYDLTNKYIFHYALSILKDPEASQDVMQNTYIKIMQKISLYQDNTNPGAWITTIVRNLAYDELKARGRVQSVDVSESEYLFIEEDKYDIDAPTIKLAMKVLPSDEYQILSMSLFNDMKRRDIAKILKLPISTVTWKYLKALRTLKEHLKKEGISNEE